MSFGQGIATTGIQLLSAYGAILNDGIYIPPTIIKGPGRLRPSKRVIKPETSAALKEILLEAVEDGTGKSARLKHFRIAGKTSTAQRPSAEEGYRGYIPAFLGFPVGTDPSIVIYVYVDDPKGSRYYGNQIAAPVFQKIAHHILYRGKNTIRVGKNGI